MTPLDQKDLLSICRNAAALMYRCEAPCLHTLYDDGTTLYILSVSSVPRSAVQSCNEQSSPVLLPDGTSAPATPAFRYCDHIMIDGCGCYLRQDHQGVHSCVHGLSES